MPGPHQPKELALFADFTLDVRTGELHQDGRPSLRLSEQPLQILIALLVRPGELVTREDLQKKLWPNDTVVEFEHSINAAINRLRIALGDTAKNPQFIETLARKGYRWKTAVEWREQPGSVKESDPASSEVRSPSSTSQLIGKKVLHYRVLGILGGGGMGIVYRAEDLKLGRAVALKFLPDELANDPTTMARFSREARAASALNHPNICTIYQVEEHEGRPFLVMELLEGKTLRDIVAEHTAAHTDRSPHEALPLQTVIDIGIQIADGLAAAHEQGIVHRDVKPANIFLTSKGAVKLLDFGLAKRWQGEAELERQREGAESRPQHDQDLTLTGTTVGTAGYMSPEQIRGEPPDARSDLFSLGLVLYELTSGTRAFSGKTAAELRSQVLDHVPAPVLLLNPKAPIRLAELINRAMEKNLEARIPSAAEMSGALRRIKADLGPESEKLRRRWWLGAAAALLIALAAFVWPGRNVHSKSRTVGSWKQRQLTVNSNENPVTGGAISPDGKYLVYTDFNGFHLKPLEGGDVIRLPDPDVYKQNQPKWEIGNWLPDSAHFFAIAELPQKDSELWLISSKGEAPRKLADAASPWGVSPDGSSVALTKNNDHEIWALESNGGKQTLLLNGGQDSRFRAMSWSPDGRRMVYLRNATVAGRNESFIEVLDRNTGARRELASGPAIRTVSDLEEGFQELIWLSAERVVFVGGVEDIHGVSCNFWELLLDPKTGELVSGPEQVTNWAGFCATTLSKTADSKNLAFVRSSDLISVFVADVDLAKKEMGSPHRLTLTEDLSSVLGWSSDGRALYIRSNREGKWGVFKQNIDSSNAEAVVTQEQGMTNVRLTPDKHWILYQRHDPADPPAVSRLMRVAITGGSEQEVLRGRNFEVDCGIPPRGLCVIAETPDNGQLIFSRLDPYQNKENQGKGPELGRVQRPHADELMWALSPDGMEVALAQGYANEFEVLSFRDRQLRRTQILSDAHLRDMTWSPSADGLYVSSAVRQGAQLLFVDRTGKSRKMWELDGSNTYLRAMASPDGKKIAIDGSGKSSNLWVLQDSW